MIRPVNQYFYLVYIEEMGGVTFSLCPRNVNAPEHNVESLRPIHCRERQSIFYRDVPIKKQSFWGLKNNTKA